MGRLAYDTRQYHASRIRSVMVLTPGASAYEIQKALERSDQPLSLDPRYIQKIRDKIIGERARRNDLLTIGPRIAYIQDKKQLIDSQLWRLITDPATGDRAKVQALGLLMKNETDLLQAEMDAGIFERKIGTLAVERGPMESEHKTRVIDALEKWGMVRTVPQLSTSEKAIVNQDGKQPANQPNQ